MRTEWLAGILALATMAGCVDETADDGTESAATDGETIETTEPTWEVRLDQAEADEGGFQLLETEQGLRLETGPAGVFYDPAYLVESGDFSVSAAFTDRGAPSDHREAYGLFLGGRDMQGPEVSYTYFLVRSTGEYLIKQRDGEETRDVVGWTSHDAVRSADEAGGTAAAGTGDATAGTGDTAAGEGEAGSEGAGLTNTLTVRTSGDTVRFLVNGTEVEALGTDEVRPWGMVGMRANHRLSLDIRDWDVTGAGVGQGAGEGTARPGGEGPDTAGGS